jgi:hypothetical protein
MSDYEDNAPVRLLLTTLAFSDHSVDSVFYNAQFPISLLLDLSRRVKGRVNGHYSVGANDFSSYSSCDANFLQMCVNFLQVCAYFLQVCAYCPSAVSLYSLSCIPSLMALNSWQYLGHRPSTSSKEQQK